MTCKIFRGIKPKLIREVDFLRIAQNVHLSDLHNRFKVIEIFYLFMYSIKINLFKHKLWIKYGAEQWVS